MAYKSEPKPSKRGSERKGIKRPRFSLEYMDQSADPHRDFYRYANGKWIDSHPVPPDKTRWGAFNELYDWNLYLLSKIVKSCSVDGKAPQGSARRLVGDFYASAMNAHLIEKRQFSPIEDLWHAASKVETSQDISRLIPRLHLCGVHVFFRSFSRADKKNSSVYALYVYQGGISLPDREYYISPAFASVREHFRRHIERMFRLKGVPPAQSKSWAQHVLETETALAQNSRSRAELRDQEKNYNRTDLSKIDTLYPRLALCEYMREVGVPPVPYVVVGQPEFFAALDGDLETRPIESVRAYVLWHVLSTFAPYLHSRVYREHFDFFNRKLLGQKRPESRQKRAVRLIDEEIGEALGKLYVERHFTEEASRRMQTLVEDIKAVFRSRLEGIPWMTEATRKKALEKFDRFQAKIGHPASFRDYSGLRIDAEDLIGNIRRAEEYEFRRQMGRVGTPVDRSEWFMTPPTVNAYFSPTENEIVFPAGILQPPFFDAEMDDAVNYGGIGAVIGHEMTHGYDDQGRRYDADGNLRDWWTPEDEREFQSRARKIVELYSAQEPLPGVFVNGELTLGENIADFGGLSLAFEALQRRLAKEPIKRRPVDDLTPEQRFFISYAQIWRQTIRDEEIRRLVTIDPHSPARYRAVLPAINHPAFEKAFPGQKGEGGTARVPGVW